MFISTFVLEHLTHTLCDEKPIEYLIKWDMIPEYNLFTGTGEAVWPFLMREFGDNIPIDILLKVNRMWDWTANATNQSLSFKLDVKVEGYLHVPDGSRKLVGTAEYYDGEIIVGLNIKNMTLSG